MVDTLSRTEPRCELRRALESVEKTRSLQVARLTDAGDAPIFIFIVRGDGLPLLHVGFQSRGALRVDAPPERRKKHPRSGTAGLKVAADWKTLESA